MDTFDSHRSTVPARLPGPRPGTSALRTSAGTSVASTPSPLSIRVALRGARRYWWLVLMLWLVGSAAVGAAIYMNVKPTYRASALLRVEPTVGDLYGVRDKGESLDAFLNTQVQLILSPNVLTAAGTNPKALALPRIQTAVDVPQELRKVISVGGIGGTYLIEVAMASPNNFECAVLVNAVVDAFLDANVEWSDGMTKTQIKNLETYKVDLKNQTDELERQWRDLVNKGDVDAQMLQESKVDHPVASKSEQQGAGRGSVTVEEYKRVRQDLFTVEMELAAAQGWLAAAKSAINKGGRKALSRDDQEVMERQVERRFRLDPEVGGLAEQMMQANTKLEDIRRTVRQSGDPSERAAMQRLKRLQDKYNQLWEAKSMAFREDFEAGGGKGFDPEQEVRDADHKVKELTARKTALKLLSKELEITNKRQATDSVLLTLILEERQSLKSMQDAIVRRLEQLRFEAKGEARIRLVADAKPPGKPIADKRMQYMAMTPAGILGTVLCLIVLLEIRAGRVADPDVLSSRIKHEVFSIAPLPNIRPGEDPNGDKAEQRLARFVQSLDHLRVAICEGGLPGEGRCVMITSATGGEGKTTLSAHLAARCANSGTSTLLIDADLRRGSLGRLLDVPVGPGLGDVLGGDIDLDEALITVQAGGFHFLSAGTPGRDPSRVLKSTRLSMLINRLRHTYDLVIIDTPPVLPVADALIMGRWADGAVMAARFDASRLPLVERANRQLALAGIPVLGVVVNGVKGQDATYGNYAYSYNYYPARVDGSAEVPEA